MADLEVLKQTNTLVAVETAKATVLVVIGESRSQSINT